MGCAKDAKSLYQEAEDTIGEHNALNSIVDLHLADEKPDQALSASVESVDRWKQLGKKRAQAEAMCRVVQVYTQLEYSNDAKTEITDARALCQEVGAAGLEAKLLIMMAQLYVGDLAKMELPARESDEPLPEAFIDIRTKALTVVKDALLLAGKAGDRALRAAALFWRSQVLVWGFAFSKGADALRSALESERLFGQIKDFKGQVHSMVLCADLHFMLGQKKEAKDRATKALDLAQKRSECGDAEEGAQTVLSRVAPEQAAPKQDQGDQGGALAVQEQGQAPAIPKNMGLKKEDIMPKVMELIAGAIVDGEFDMDTPLFDAGLDSLSSVTLTGDLGRQFSLPLAPSVTFDFPTARQLVDHLVEESKGG